jgi:hypothetical protein
MKRLQACPWDLGMAILAETGDVLKERLEQRPRKPWMEWFGNPMAIRTGHWE